MSLASVAGTLKQVPSLPMKNLNVGARKTLGILQTSRPSHVETYVAKSSISADSKTLER